MKILVLLVVLFVGYNICNDLFHAFYDLSSFSPATLFEILLDLLLTGLCVYFSQYIIRRILDKSPGLILNKEGIMDNSGLVSAGLIQWNDVTEINTNKVIFADCIIVKVRNPKQYIYNQRGFFIGSWLGIENRYFGSPINISVSGLAIKFQDLFRIVQQHYMQSQVEYRTGDLQREKAVIQQEKNELINSINYAKRIQTSLLPSFASIQQLLGDCFVLYLPKDIVSGDFYWVNTHHEWVFFSVCDCTGHGVPGALISIVCNNALNRAVKEFGIVQPSGILDKVSDLIAESMGNDSAVKDGMDASLFAFNKTNRELYWSGANIPLWIARQDTFYELLEFKPDKQSVGALENRKPYTTHPIPLKKGDILYLFSDGYADQFGGTLGKKLTRKKFKELLMSQRGISLNEQHANLLRFHQEYKGSQDQVDDILVMGIRIEQ